MTIFEIINEWVQAHVEIPLSRFFTMVTYGLLIIMPFMIIVAPMSFSKLLSVSILYLLSIFTAILAYGNYHVEDNRKFIEELPKVEEKSADPEQKTLEVKSTLNEDFIA